MTLVPALPAQITCRVEVDGAALADDGATFLSPAPTVLAGLSLTWGRDTVTDQPAVSSASFTVADAGANLDWLDLLHVGRTVAVYATADEAAAGGGVSNVAVDGEFELTNPVTMRASGGAGTNPQGGTLAYTSDSHSGRAIQVTQPNSPGVLVPMAPFSTNPAAWDLLPTPNPGDQWTITVWVRTPWAATVTARAGGLSRPNPGNFSSTWWDQPVTVPPANAWQQTQIDFTPSRLEAGAFWPALFVYVTVYTWATTPGTWADIPTWATWNRARTTIVDSLQVLAPIQAQTEVPVFSGRITDLATSQTDVGVQVAVTASDWTADLGNDYVGDTPWPAESMTTRTQRILALLARTVTARIDTWPGNRTISWRDVDHTAAYGLLQDLATSTDAILWSAWSDPDGFYLWFEDPTNRALLGTLTLDPSTGLVTITGNTRAGVVLSACRIERDPVSWTQDVSDVITRVDVSWLEQTTDPDTGQPATVDHTVEVIDTSRETDWGQRGMSTTTQLTSGTDAQTIATRQITRSATLGWKASGLAWATDLTGRMSSDDVATALRLLDGTTRIGLPITLTDLPPWAPDGSVYLEGATCSYQGGAWSFELTVSPSGMVEGGGGGAVTWAQLDPAWTWAQFDPSVTWAAIGGAAAAGTSAPAGTPPAGDNLVVKDIEGAHT